MTDEDLADFGAFALGQLRGLKADHHINLEYPNVIHKLPRDEMRRGEEHARAWVENVETRGRDYG